MELKPNVSFPLAVSYNERGIDGFTNISDRDQYKINVYYQPIRNSFSQEMTLYLTKRPGATSSASQSGANGLHLYHLINAVNSDPTNTPWTIGSSTSAGTPTSTRIIAAVSVTTIFAQGATAPIFATAGFINSVDTRVVQISQSGVVQRHRTFYASSVALWEEIVSTYSTHVHRGKLEIMDGFGFQLTSSNRIQNSNINTISTWPSANFITKEIISDFPVGLARFKNQLLAFGYETVEVFYNAGLSPAPLARIGTLTSRIGLQRDTTLSATEYYAIVGGRLYFNSNFDGVHAYDGARFEKISTPAIDKIFAETPPYSVDKISFHNQEAVSFRLSQITETTYRFMLFFPRVNEWFEWNSNIFKPMGNGIQFIGIIGNETTTYRLGNSTAWYDRAIEPFSSVIQFKFPGNGARQQMNTFGVIGDTESSTTTSQLQIEFSDDDGQTFGSVRTIDMTQNAKYLTRCGAFKQRTVRLTHVGNTEIRLEKVIANVK